MSKTKSYEWPLARFPPTSSSHLAWCYFRFCFVLLVWSYISARSLGCLVISFCKLRYNLECFAFKLIYYFNIRFSRNKPTSICLLSGDKGIRTLDPLLARQVLSQLSYTPMGIWQPPAFPCRLQHSIIGRFSLNHRVRDVDGCFPKTYRHQKTASRALALHALEVSSKLPFVINFH